MQPAREAPRDRIAAFQSATEAAARARRALKGVVFGQDAAVELALAAVVAGGHALLVGAPGLAKTKLVHALGKVLGLQTGRVQFTPDLLPSDITGTDVLDENPEGRRFRFEQGPIFRQLLMADEINRASPRTQSALLEAMQEGAVTSGGVTRPLPKPFHVLATQNPIEQEGTYPLPEAQLDRFLVQIDMSYPDRDDERRVLIETTGWGDVDPPAVLDAETLIELQKLAVELPVGESVVDAILELVRRARPDEAGAPAVVARNVQWGPGPRAGQALMRLARARALLDGRPSPSLGDVKAQALPVLKHRMILSFAARADGVTPEAVVQALTDRL